MAAKLLFKGFKAAASLCCQICAFDLWHCEGIYEFWEKINKRVVKYESQICSFTEELRKNILINFNNGFSFNDSVLFYKRLLPIDLPCR